MQVFIRGFLSFRGIAIIKDHKKGKFITIRSYTNSYSTHFGKI